ncbi:MAG: hypothetical protein LBC80_07745 [Treponema sp.]|nr:hypothetical protein [Treponema sp.]
MKKFFLILICFSLLAVNLPAEHEISFRVAPAFEVPFGFSQFGSGAGAAASLDWAFLRFARNFNFGLSAGGSFTSLAVQIGEPLTVMEGKAGPFLRWRPYDRWAFRTGVDAGMYQFSREEDNGTNSMFSFSLGAEFYMSPYFSLFVDNVYSYKVFSRDPLTSYRAAVGLKVNLSEIVGGTARITDEKTEQFRIFPVSWAWYENNPVATVKITNHEPNTITDVRVSFFMDSFMNQPWTAAILPRLASGESAYVQITALFNEAKLSLTENINANGILQMNYRSLGASKVTTSPIQMPIFHRNTLSWDDDRRAAAFVSPRDSAARFFARFVAGAVEAHITSRPAQSSGQANVPPNVLYAAALFEALRLYGITYVVVPATSFVNVRADESVLDNVSYPYQALYYRGGDCSYLSILFCSLLEVLNIESAFITIPGHIFVAFEVGDNNWRPNNADIIELDGKRWLPVEITVPGQGFTRAWRIGARQWRNYGEEATLFPIREAWNIYPSVTVPSSGDHLPQMPEWSDIIRAMEREVRNY